MVNSKRREAFAQAVGANVAAIRETKGLSQEELGFRAELHRTAIGDLERGENTPRLDSALRIAACLGVPLDSLVAGIGWRSPEFAAGDFSYEKASQSK
jgi:transcriptional regulator with XRE-family HTH domain